jgi:hypothetical protein
LYSVEALFIDLITKCWVHLLEIAYKGIEDTQLLNLLFAETGCVQFGNGIAAFVMENIINPLLALQPYLNLFGYSHWGDAEHAKPLEVELLVVMPGRANIVVNLPEEVVSGMVWGYMRHSLQLW